MVQKPSYIYPSNLIKGESKYYEIEPPKVSAVYLARNFLPRIVNVLTTPTLVHDAPRPQNIMVTNPAATALTGFAPGTGLVTQQIGVVGAGNSQATPVGVAGYMNMQLFLNITGIAAGTTWSFFNQVLDPVTLNWTDSQALVAAVTPAVVATWTNAQYYLNIAGLGVGIQFATRWTLDAGAGAITFTISYILKQGLGGSPFGAIQVIYLGSSSGVQIGSGYPLLEGSEKVFQIAENTQLWAIARTITPIMVFELT